MASRKKSDGGRSIPVDARSADRIHASFEIKVAKAILDRSPSSIEALTLLGAALTRAGRHEEALEVDLRTTSILKNEPAPHYNLACSYSMLDRVDEAIAELKKALDLGYRDFNHMLQDPDLKNARRDPRFRDLLQRKWGKRQP
jgi:tetratricopeptide (TPR) repeat protein